jgi:hypothetical protein
MQVYFDSVKVFQKRAKPANLVCKSGKGYKTGQKNNLIFNSIASNWHFTVK